MPEAESFAEPAPMPAVSAPAPERLTWRETCRLIRSDYDRVPEIAEGRASRGQRVLVALLPGQLGLTVHRVARYLHLREWHAAATALAILSTYLTRVEIPPTTSIGAGCHIAHPPVILCGRIGERFTSYGIGGCGRYGTRDIGAGPGFPIIGDDVVLSVKATINGSVRIGNGARLGPGATVLTDVPDGGVVVGALSRVARGRAETPPGSDA